MVPVVLLNSPKTGLASLGGLPFVRKIGWNDRGLLNGTAKFLCEAWGKHVLKDDTGIFLLFRLEQKKRKTSENFHFFQKTATGMSRTI